MNKLRSSAITQGVQRSPNRSMLRAVGFNDEDLVDFPAFINVQVRHAVFNNNEPRINLQASFIEPIEDCVKMFEEADSYELHTS